MTNSITLKNISYQRKNKLILSIDLLTIPTDIVTGIIGPNGAGKSTLLKVMALLETPNTGSISINGQQVWPGTFRISERRKLAYVFQQPLMLDTTVYKNVEIGLKYRKIERKERRKKVNEWLERFHILHLADQNANRLSGGEAQRVALARAFVTEPEVLFLDEPFSALDLPTKKNLLKDFKHILHETKTTTIFISHDYEEIKYMCQHVAVLLDGKLQSFGNLSSIHEDKIPFELKRFLDDWTTPLSANLESHAPLREERLMKRN